MRNRHADFPQPVAVVGRQLVWLRGEVIAWARATGRPVHE